MTHNKEKMVFVYELIYVNAVPVSTAIIEYLNILVFNNFIF